MHTYYWSILLSSSSSHGVLVNEGGILLAEKGPDRVLDSTCLQQAFVCRCFSFFLCDGVGYCKKVQEELRGFQHALEAEVEEEKRQAEHQLKLLVRSNEVELQEVTRKDVNRSASKPLRRINIHTCYMGRVGRHPSHQPWDTASLPISPIDECVPLHM